MKTSTEWAEMCAQLAVKLDTASVARDQLVTTRQSTALAVELGEPRAKLDKVNADLAKAQSGVDSILAALGEAMRQEEVAREAEAAALGRIRKDTLKGLVKARQAVCDDLLTAARPFVAAILAEMKQREVCQRENVPVPKLNQAPVWTLALCQAAKEAGIVHPFLMLEGLDMHPDFCSMPMNQSPYLAGFNAKTQEVIQAI